LKVGDKLRFIVGPQKMPKKGEVVTVYSLTESEVRNTEKEKEGAQIFRFDFTALFERKDDDGDYLLEYLQDSRYYELITE
jgi:hypothetical protein